MGRRPLGTILHSSNEPGELSQWLCHDDSTINIVVRIIIIIIISSCTCERPFSVTQHLNYRLKTKTDEFKAAYVRETVIGYKNEDLVERIIRLQRVGFVVWLYHPPYTLCLSLTATPLFLLVAVAIGLEYMLRIAVSHGSVAQRLSRSDC